MEFQLNNREFKNEKVKEFDFNVEFYFGFDDFRL
jgi:hypothetical protein